MKSRHVVVIACVLIGLALGVFAAGAPRAGAAPAATTYLVAGTSDSVGACYPVLGGYGCPSLRSAIIAANANPGSTVALVHGATYNLTLAPGGSDDASTGDLNITADMSINFGGVLCLSDCGATIKGGAGWNDRILSIDTGAHVDISGVTIQGGHVTDDGGGIWNLGFLTLWNCTVISNTTFSEGGGIFSKYALTLNGATLTGNSAAVDGGALFLLGTSTLNDSSLTSNVSDLGSGIVARWADLTLSHTVVLSNKPDILAAADAIVGQYGTTITVTNNSNISNNTGTAILSNGGVLKVSNSVISNNAGVGASVVGGQATFVTSLVSGNAGGLYLGGGGLLNVTGGWMINNQGNGITIVPPDNALGGTAHITGGALVSGNTGTGIDIGNGLATLDSVEVSGNGTLGIVNGHCGYCYVNIVTMTNVLVQDNGTLPFADGVPGGLANGGWGSAFLTDNTFRNNQGGAIANGSSGQLFSTGDTFVSNHAENGGAIWNIGSMFVTNANIISNTAATHGGAVYNFFSAIDPTHPHTGTLTMSLSNIAYNTAGAGGGGLFKSASNGGGLSNQGVLTITTSNIMSNQAAEGGGIWNDPESIALVTGTTLVNNAAKNTSGGGVANYAGTLTLINDTLYGNTAALDGGGAYNSGGLLSLNNATVAYNVADVNLNGSGNGGGLANDTVGPGTLSFANSIVARNVNMANTAPDCAGTLYSWGYDLVESLNGCTWSGTTTGRITGQNPLLGVLKYNGGPILAGNQPLMTQALLMGSPALGAGNPGAPGTYIRYCAGADERGVSRPQGTRCDIGAYEGFPLRLFLPVVRR